MKKTFFTILILTTIILTVTSCKDKAKEAETTEAEDVSIEIADSETYIAITEASTIEWKGFKPTGSHHGTIGIESGGLEMSNNKIVGGTFNIDMTSIVVKDIPTDDEKNGKLLGHLKSPDFFDVENHKTAVFTITGIEEVEGQTLLSGNLAIKNIENNITFPISVTKDENGIVLSSEAFSIDRSKWDVKYGSKSFFDNLGDKFINDDIELKIVVKAS
jgi:hypothetical protein